MYFLAPTIKVTPVPPEAMKLREASELLCTTYTLPTAGAVITRATPGVPVAIITI